MPPVYKNYERFCAIVLKTIGLIEAGSKVFLNRKVKGVRQSGLYEIDIFSDNLKPNGERVTWMFECKLLRRKVEREVIQKVAQTRDAISVTRAAVISSVGFSKEAKKVAEELQVMLLLIPWKPTSFEDFYSIESIETGFYPAIDGKDLERFCEVIAIYDPWVDCENLITDRDRAKAIDPAVSNKIGSDLYDFKEPNEEDHCRTHNKADYAKRLNIGVIGHIDSGKTTLSDQISKALTQLEERERGIITITRSSLEYGKDFHPYVYFGSLFEADNTKICNSGFSQTRMSMQPVSERVSECYDNQSDEIKIMTSSLKLVPIGSTGSVIEFIQDKLGRKMDGKETDFVTKIEKRYLRYLVEGEFHDHDMVRISPHWEITSYESLELWPMPPSDILEFWNYVAYALHKKKLAYPEFMNIITDLESVHKKITEWEQEIEVSSWYDRIESFGGIGCFNLLNESPHVDRQFKEEVVLILTTNELRLSSHEKRGVMLPLRDYIDDERYSTLFINAAMRLELQSQIWSEYLLSYYSNYDDSIFSFEITSSHITNCKKHENYSLLNEFRVGNNSSSIFRRLKKYKIWRGQSISSSCSLKAVLTISASFPRSGDVKLSYFLFECRQQLCIHPNYDSRCSESTICMDDDLNVNASEFVAFTIEVFNQAAVDAKKVQVVDYIKPASASLPIAPSTLGGYMQQMSNIAGKQLRRCHHSSRSHLSTIFENSSFRNCLN